MTCDLYDALVREARSLYPSRQYERGLCVEREWSADGERELARYPYTRVRFVPVFDALAWVEGRGRVEIGIRAEVQP